MIEILLEDNHCLAVNKPAGMLSQGDSTGAPSVVDEVRAYLKAAYSRPGNVYVGLVHRLDRPTSGVLLLARTSKGASRLSGQFRDGLVEKTSTGNPGSRSTPGSCGSSIRPGPTL
jgi:23S rRNA pseudouridine1911/1915/1917 synthase